MLKNLKNLINAASSDNIKVLSFDIFDTLLLRSVASPTDIFGLVEQEIPYDSQFVEMRINAEKKARERIPFNADDIELDDIYHEFMKLYDLNAEDTDSIKLLEMDVEERYLYASESVKKIYDAALTLNKEIIIVSDMYLPGEYLNKVLQKNGYTGYSKLYVSCEYKLSKATGRLYDYIVREFKEKGIQPEEIMHFGDNYFADYIQAKKHGLKAAFISRTISRGKKEKVTDFLKRANKKDILKLCLEQIHLLDTAKK